MRLRESCTRSSGARTRESCCPVTLRHIANSATVFPGKQSGGAHLSDGFLISHDSLLDESAHFDVPIPARNHHARPAEANRHFHAVESEGGLPESTAESGEEEKRYEDYRESRKEHGRLCAPNFPLIFSHGRGD